MSALESEESDTTSRSHPPYPAGTSPGTTTSAAGSSISRGKQTMMDEAVFREKLKNMGKTSKRKFSQKASIFSRRKGAKQLLGHAPAPSKDNLLLNAEPLVNDFDSEEESVPGSGGMGAGQTGSSQQDNASAKQQRTPTKGKYTSFS